jgi:hypothetical protein
MVQPRRAVLPALAVALCYCALTAPAGAVVTPTVTITGPLTAPYVGPGNQTMTVHAESPMGISRMSWTSDDGQSQTTSVGCPEGACDSTTRTLGPYDANRPTEGNHSITVEVRDAHVGTGGTHGTTSALAFAIDRTPPGSPSNIDADFDPDTGELAVSWDSAVDPALADGTAGSGLASYLYRYSHGASGWSMWQSTGFAGFDLGGVVQGEHVAVEVQAVDVVGNVSPVTSGDAAAVVPATFDCSVQEDGAYPSRCVADAEPPMDASDPQPNVALEPIASAQSSGPISQRYRVKVRDHLGQIYTHTFDRYASIRSRPNSWVYGQAPDGAIVDAEFQDDSQNSGGSPAVWDLGVVGGFTGGPDRNGCGWLFDSNLTPIASGEFGNCGNLGMTIQGFSSYTNCPHDDQNAGGHSCNHGTAVFLVAASRICANVGLNQHGDSTGCAVDGVNYLGQLEPGDCIEWRYITNDGRNREQQWVMGKLRSRQNPEASWVFIRRTALNPRNSKLPTIVSHRDQSCDA